MNVNKKYKASVFSSIFSDADALRELYSAIAGVSLPDGVPVEVNTLSDVLFMEQINDISFTIDNRLVVLIEHQSTINQNMPLRLLLYIAHVYEKIIDYKKLYKTKRMEIPTPEFIVLYNGKAAYPDRQTLRLSDSFKDAEGLREYKEIISLEVVVQVYNINKGHNPELLGRSGTLEGYSTFVEKVREYGEKLALEEAVKEAVKYCIEENKIRKYLEEHGSEVVNMLLTEWNTEEAKEVWFEEGREEGLEMGREEGLEEGLILTARNALAKGLPLDTILDITGLGREALENIQKDR